MQHRSFDAAISTTKLRGPLRDAIGQRLADIVAVAGRQGVGVTQFARTAASAVGLAGSQLADYSAISNGFLSSLSAFSAFDGMRSSMIPVPFRTASLPYISVGATVFAVNEASVKGITKLSFANATMTPSKAAAGIVLSLELVRMSVPGTTDHIAYLLQQAAARQTDAIFFASILSGVTIFSSSGVTAESVRYDIARMLQSITIGANSKLYLVITPLVASTWSMLTDSKGVSAFPDLGPMGGSINKIPVLVSDGISAGQVVLLDATSIAANAGDIALIDISQSSLQFDTAPDSPPSPATNLVSLWQNNLTGIAVERFFCGQRLRSDGISSSFNANSYQGGNSPP